MERAKVALLIGTGQYGEGFTPLPAAPRDVAAIATVLRDPERGGFDHVDTLIDQPSTTIAETIETWFRALQKDDVALLYISGHGVKDAQSRLYFAACDTHKQEKELVRSTAVAASFVHDRIRESKARRQVIILDCCFSGAFGSLLSKGDDTINLETLLGAEGRVVLTSSSSIQYSFEQKGENLSIYTRYLVEGIKTADADKDGDGKISVQELHDYAKRKVQAESPDMTPTIIVLKDEGYQIWIAKAPQGDPKVTYRQEVEKIVHPEGDKIDDVLSRIDDVLSRSLLKGLQKKLGLTHREAQSIEAKVLAPIRQRQAKVTDYRDTLTEVLQSKPTLSKQERERLEHFQRTLGLRDEDVEAIHDELLPQPPILEPPQLITETPNTVASVLVPQLEVILKSEKGLNYTELERLLRKKKWKLADEETYRLMIQAVGKAKGDRFSSEELLNFPSADLQTIDRLWVTYSRGAFGFSVQKRILKSCGVKPYEKYGNKIWNKFSNRVGWRRDESYVEYDVMFKHRFKHNNCWHRGMTVGSLPVAVVLQSAYSPDKDSDFETLVFILKLILILILFVASLFFSQLCSYQIAKVFLQWNVSLFILVDVLLLIFFEGLLLYFVAKLTVKSSSFASHEYEYEYDYEDEDDYEPKLTVKSFSFLSDQYECSDEMYGESTWLSRIINGESPWLNSIINRSKFNFSLLNSLLSHRDLRNF